MNFFYGDTTSGVETFWSRLYLSPIPQSHYTIFLLLTFVSKRVRCVCSKIILTRYNLRLFNVDNLFLRDYPEGTDLPGWEG